MAIFGLLITLSYLFTFAKLHSKEALARDLQTQAKVEGLIKSVLVVIIIINTCKVIA
jgi:uncharacterized membrane protein YobD (UPF0266 family)